MYVSNYPHTVMLGDVEMRIFLKFLRNESLTDDEEIRADQMKDTLEKVFEKKANPRSHRIPGQDRKNQNRSMQNS